jgi:hypothetical protein
MWVRSGVLAALALSLSFVAPAIANTETADCTVNSSALVALLESGTVNAGDTVNVNGTCVGNFALTLPNLTLESGLTGTPGTIQGIVNIQNLGEFIVGLTIDGSGSGGGEGLRASGLALGVQPGSGSSVTVTDCIIENWDIAVTVSQGAFVILYNVTLQNSAQSNLEVEQATVAVINGVIEGSGNSNPGVQTIPGVQLLQGANASFDGTTIERNAGAGIVLSEGSVLHLGYQGPLDLSEGPYDAVLVTGNQAGGIIATDNSQVFINLAEIHGNTGGPALQLSHSSADINGGTVSSNAGLLTQPTIVMLRSGLLLYGPSGYPLTVTGTGVSPAIYAMGNSTVTMLDTTVTDADAVDAAIVVDDGSALLSEGGNTISNTAANGIAIEALNGSTFHQHIAETQFLIPPGADTITGIGTVQVQSNMELGTGGTTPSTWTGAIAVQQNSSFRMDGGITITGGVSLIQGSNGFFNKSAGGTNSVTVTCGGTDSSHVAGANAVSPAVTLVTVGVGCYAF